MKRLVRSTLLVPVLLALSCVPEFENGLPRQDGAGADPELLGRWSAKGDGEEDEALFYPRPNGWYDILFIAKINSASETNGLDVSIYEGYSASVGDEKFLCIRGRRKDFADHSEPPESYRFLLAHYRIGSNDELRVNFFSSAKVEELVKSGALQGEVKTNQFTDDVIVTAPSDAVAAAIAEKGYREFVDVDDVMKFSRMK